MPQLPSFRALSPSHQAFVSAYIRNDCNAVRALDQLKPGETHEVQVRRGWKLLQRPDVKLAIGDLLDRQAEKHLLSREDMLRELYELISRANGLPDAGQKLSTLKFSKDVLDSMAKVLGYNSSTVNQTGGQEITVQLVGMGGVAGAVNPTIPPVDIELTPEEPPVQLELSFPPSDPIPFDLSDLDEISDPPEDLPDPDDSLPFED